MPTKTRTFLAAFFAVVVIYAFHHLYGITSPDPPAFKRLGVKGKKSHQKVLVIMTQTRSGSTFTGEIFAATDNSMYLYEPLYPYGLGCRFPSERESLLTQLLNCDFRNLNDIYSSGFKQSGWAYDVAGCIERGFCFTSKSPGFLENYLKACSNTTKKFDAKSKDCGYPLRAEILSKVCNSSSLLLTKANRICTLEEMDKIYSDLKTLGKDVYVLHMLRDVRSIASSVLKIAGKNRIKSVVRAIINERCPRQRRNVVLKGKAYEEYSMMADGRYMRIRYEDLARNATNAAKRVFKFMGKSLPEKVVSNIVSRLHPNKTVLQQITSKERAGKKIQELSKQYQNPYGVVRDPMKVLNEWRELIPFEYVQEIQKNCEDVLQELGYVMFSSKEQMSDLSLPSFSNVPDLQVQQTPYADVANKV